MSNITRRALSGLALGGALATRVRAEDKFHLRCSLDTSATHGRTIFVGEYLKELEKASGGRIETELFHSGQLYRDRDIGKAMRQGAVEMSVPGTWELTGFVPDADVVWMGTFVGRTPDEVHQLTDGPIGKMVNEELEKALSVKVLGSWFDLGYSNFYTIKKPLETKDDMKGLKMRVSGGTAQFLHVKFYGGAPDLTAWPDVPLALSQGLFDGLGTTNESFASAKLWETGVKYAFITHENLGQYIPMIGARFWQKLPPDLQKVMIDTWAANNPRYRKEMEKRQDNARKQMEEHGVKFIDPSPEQMAVIRNAMVALTDDWAKDMKISAPMLALIKQIK